MELLNLNYKTNAGVAEKLPPALVQLFTTQQPVAMDQATPEILNALEIEEHMSKVQKK